jgi:hypothetical protein
VARHEDVDLVAAHRPDLGLPEHAGFGIEREAVTVAVAVGIDFRLCAFSPNKRVIARHGTVVVQPQSLADVIA